MACKTTPAITAADAPGSSAAERKNNLRKNLGCFARCSPSNSFRINKSFSESSKTCVQFHAIYAPQPVWNQHAVGSFATGAQSLFNPFT